MSQHKVTIYHYHFDDNGKETKEVHSVNKFYTEEEADQFAYNANGQFILVEHQYEMYKQDGLLDSGFYSEVR